MKTNLRVQSNIRVAVAVAGVIGALASGITRAQTTFQEDFTGNTLQHNWFYFNGACLTAGTAGGTGVVGSTAGLIPSCSSILGSYYQTRPDADPTLVGGASGTLADPVGSG